jgi:hypothetical protein
MSPQEIQSIADLTAKFLGLTIRPKAIIKETSRGYAWTDKGWFTMPQWAIDHSEECAMYIIIHEICHFLNGGLDHGTEFASVEDRALEFWNLKIERTKKNVYAKKIISKRGVFSI